MKLVMSVALLALLGYAAVAAALYFAQSSIFFPARIVPPAGPLPSGAEEVELAAPDGAVLKGVLIPPMAGEASDVLIIGFAGNASNAAAIAEFLGALYPEHRIAAFHYRGYAPSTGKPSAAALLQDAPLVHDWLRARFARERMVAVGISIGSGVAAGLAAARPIDGLILVTPFDSLAAVAQQRFPWLPVRWLVRHEMPAAELLRESEIPVAIIAAERDGVVPPARAHALARAVPKLVRNVTLAGADHNSVAAHPEFRGEMRAALQAVLRSIRGG